MRRTLLLFVALFALAMTGLGRTAAQESSPVPGIVPNPSECMVEPRSVDDLLALWFPGGSPVAATPESSPADVSGGTLDVNEQGTPVGAVFDVPVGDPADAETIDRVTATVVEVFACFNGGDFLRAYTLFSDGYLASFAADLGGMSPEDAREIFAQAPGATPIPEEQWIELIAITNVTLTDDGRIGAVITSVDPTVDPEGGVTVLAYFVEQDGRLVLDEIIEDAVGTEADQDSNIAATPDA